MLVSALVLDGCVKEAPATDPIDPRQEATRDDGSKPLYVSFGEGPPLVIINGGMGLDSYDFEVLARLLADGHRTIIYDRRGTGPNSTASQDITMNALVEDLEAIRVDLGVESWDVLGHSFGGMVASYYATKHPTRIEHLVLSSSSGVDMSLFEGDPIAPIHARLSEEDRKRITELEGRHAAGDEDSELYDEFSEIIARAYVVDDRLAPRVAARLRRTRESTEAALTEDLGRIAFDCKDALADFGSPVLVIHGEQDVFPLRVSELAAETMPNARLVVLPNSGHYGWLDAPESYRDLVLAFLSS